MANVVLSRHFLGCEFFVSAIVAQKLEYSFYDHRSAVAGGARKDYFVSALNFSNVRDAATSGDGQQNRLVRAREGKDALTKHPVIRRSHLAIIKDQVCRWIDPKTQRHLEDVIDAIALGSNTPFPTLKERHRAAATAPKLHMLKRRPAEGITI